MEYLKAVFNSPDDAEQKYEGMQRVYGGRVDKSWRKRSKIESEQTHPGPKLGLNNAESSLGGDQYP